LKEQRGNSASTTVAEAAMLAVQEADDDDDDDNSGGDTVDVGSKKMSFPLENSRQFWKKTLKTTKCKLQLNKRKRGGIWVSTSSLTLLPNPWTDSILSPLFFVHIGCTARLLYTEYTECT
jgi:hypothetical protein